MNKLEQILDALLESGTITTLEHMAINSACLYAKDNVVDFAENYGTLNVDKITELLKG